MVFSENRITQFKILYESIINNAKLKNRKRSISLYLEKHHITPKCLGGTNTKDNLVMLTAREHFICHWLLSRIYTNPKIIQAFFIMCNKTGSKLHKRNYKVNSKVYENVKTIYSKSISGKNHPLYGTKGNFYGKKHTQETLDKMRLKKNSEETLEKMRKPKSIESKQNYSKAKSGENHPMFGKQGTFYGKKHTQETLDKISLIWKNRPLLICPHCNLQGKGPNMKRYHFDKCKFKII